MRRKLIMWLIRRKLGLKNYDGFKFLNQASDNIYFFCDGLLLRMDGKGKISQSHVGLNYLLSEKCEISICDRLHRVVGEIEDDWWNDRDRKVLK